MYSDGGGVKQPTAIPTAASALGLHRHFWNQPKLGKSLTNLMPTTPPSVGHLIGVWFSATGAAVTFSQLSNSVWGRSVTTAGHANDPVKGVPGRTAPGARVGLAIRTKTGGVKPGTQPGRMVMVPDVVAIVPE